MENKYGGSHGIVKHRSGIWTFLRDGDFEEEEVWDVMKDRNDHHGISKSKVVTSSSPSPIAVPRPLPTAAKMIPIMAAASSNNNNSSISTSSSHKTQVVLHQSAPVSIPDWSKIYRTNKKTKTANEDYVSRCDDDHGLDHYCHNDDDDDDDDEEDVENDDEFDARLPPHEFIARRLARSQISSFSVLEGVGRTLKGRDLSEVRNAVLTKTGFLESL
ncbi:protein S40-7-like [Prosopis cineraria]|uniref:protein S40-7-like n=1 Tax=Prosopis cineraria TaxID=364024 RepID=UPI00240EA1B7|nr:protein S40-7-like [Prosopis cineraria]